MPSAIFVRSASSLREEDPIIQRLIRDSEGNYGTFARVLFPIEEDQIEIKHIFLSMYLVTVSSPYPSARLDTDVFIRFCS